MTANNGLELNEDRAFQEKFWIAERVAWIAMVAVLALALLGLTGRGGPLATATVSTPQGEVTYPRVTRWEADDSLTFKLAPGGAEATVDLSSTFGQLFEIVDIQPAPHESRSTANGQRLLFKLGDPSGTREVVIHVRAAKPSLGRQFDVRINGGEPVSLRAVVLP